MLGWSECTLCQLQTAQPAHTTVAAVLVPCLCLLGIHPIGRRLLLLAVNMSLFVSGLFSLTLQAHKATGSPNWLMSLEAASNQWLWFSGPTIRSRAQSYHLSTMPPTPGRPHPWHHPSLWQNGFSTSRIQNVFFSFQKRRKGRSLGALAREQGIFFPSSPSKPPLESLWFE